MLKVINNFKQSPHPFQAAEDISFEPGKIGQLDVRDGNVVCIISDGNTPLGVVDGLLSNNVYLWLTRFLGQTDQFDKNLKYSINSILYVSKNGLLTPRTIEEDTGIAICTGIGDYLEFLWL